MYHVIHVIILSYTCNIIYVIHFQMYLKYNIDRRVDKATHAVAWGAILGGR